MPNPQDDAREYYAALGKAIANWQGVEQRLAFIFVHLVQSKHGFKIFDGIISIRDKISVIDDIMHAEIANDPLLEQWILLRKKIERSSRRRNKIVHAYTMMLPKPGRPPSFPVDPMDGSYQYVAGPGFSKLVSLAGPVQYRTVHQLQHLATAFELLTTRVASFYDGLNKRKAC